ncbi:hypothetical protein PHMEG_00018107 [Phytophthora megakarya]|uniref:Uncharacterized protein n=1 Tax=Phytophthora megakarya TaxID=4795 RepID=A0A225VVM6_9STRA|nr:hypothetical protein PHMEG_00018107 [Phytophthora megakarya]
MGDASAAATGTLVPWVSQKATNRFSWMRWIVMCNLPFSFCESEETRRFTNLPPICVETLYGDMESVVKAVEKTIGEEMPKCFGLILDGWTHGTEHFLAVYACYESPDGPRFPLLSMAPIIDEPDDALNADGHAAAIARFLPFFGRSLENVLFLVGDNCAVNKRLANLMGVPLVGCASHRLNLAVREHLAPHEDALAEVQALMRKLRTLKQAAKLRQKTSLQPVLRQETRWSSTFAMLARYFRLFEHLCPDDEDLEDLIPSRSTHRSLRKLFEELHDVESISKKLQTDGLTLLDARDLLDGLLEVQPSFRNYLAPDAPIVHSPKFETAVVKVLGGKASG